MNWSRSAVAIPLLCPLLVCSVRSVQAAPKISSTAVDKLGAYDKVYVMPIGKDFASVQPRLVDRLKKTGFQVVDLAKEKLPVTSQGTGFVLSPEGLILTCAHVVGNEQLATLWLDGKRYLARVKAVDTNIDAALVQLDSPPSGLPAVSFSTPGEPRLGQDVDALGFPVADLLGATPHLNRGAVSATSGMNEDVHLFQLSVPIQPGNSGGPVFDKNGAVVGMVSSTINPLQFARLGGAPPQNVNFAIKASCLKKFSETSGFKSLGTQTNAVIVPGESAEDRYERLGKSTVLVRAGVVDETRLKERALLCACSYLALPDHRIQKAQLVFMDVRKFKVVLTARLESSGSFQNTAMDALGEEVADKFFPDQPNPFNPRKRKVSKK